MHAPALQLDLLRKGMNSGTIHATRGLDGDMTFRTANAIQIQFNQRRQGSRSSLDALPSTTVSRVDEPISGQGCGFFGTPGKFSTHVSCTREIAGMLDGVSPATGCHVAKVMEALLKRLEC